MFDWLAQEIQSIKTRRFHVVDGAAGPALRAAVEGSEVWLPRSYKEFALRFGSAKLYKKHGYYIVGVLAAPVVERGHDGDELYRIGHYQSSNAYFRTALLRGDDESPVFQGHGGRWVQVADGFEAWLTKRCTDARRTYSTQQWAEILAGPSPFTTSEHGLVEARKLFICRLVGATPDGKLLVEVYNGSPLVLPFLSIGIEQKDNNLQTGIWLPVSQVHPGETAVIEHKVYNLSAGLDGTKIFLLPDPEPEDRERYWEFKAIPM